MTTCARYVTTSAVVLAAMTLALWPFLDAAGRRGVLAAALLALPVQTFAFAVLVRAKGRARGFVGAWVGGMALRAVTLLAAATLAIRSGSEVAVPMLLALAGFFFALLLLEGVYFKSAPAASGGARAA
jgi:hypothetical protein